MIMSEYNKLYYKKNQEKLKERRRFYYAENPEKGKESTRLWKEKNPKKVKEYGKLHGKLYREKNQDKLEEYFKLYRERNREILREKNKLWKKNHPRQLKLWKKRNPGKVKEHNNRWVKNNLDKFRLLQKLCNYRRKGAKGSHTQGEWDLLKKQYGFTCPKCKRSEPEIKLTEDHIIPISKGGANYIENIQPLCASCNSSKGIIIISFDILTKPQEAR